MTREEAIKILSERYSSALFSERTALETLIPELKESESEDEKIRKELLEQLAYILPDQTEFDEHCNVLPTYSKRIERYRAYLEKQKEASKAIEAVEKIDKYIDEHLANAHDMKDSHPDKKYYSGWDAALGQMAGILQDVYSGEKKKEQEEPQVYKTRDGETITYSETDGYKVCDEKQQEQKSAEWSEEDEDMYARIVRRYTDYEGVIMRTKEESVASCTGGVNYRVKIHRGDIRKTYTEDYILTERCNGCNGFGIPQWEDVSIEKIANEDVSKQRESTDKDSCTRD